MDQKSLQALLQELQGLDELPKDAADPVEEPSDYTAWYEDYVKSTTTSTLSDTQPERSTSAIAAASDQGQAQVSNAPQDAPPTDLRKLTYAQALPVISRLTRDESFLDALQKLKSAQETFELSLLDERNRAKHDLEKQLKKARESASISGLQYEEERISKLLNATMAKFDKAALTRWDALVKNQQAKLEQLGVPCIYALKTPDPVAQERQRRVMDTLATLLSDV